MAPRIDNLPLLLMHLMKVGWHGECDRTQKQLALLLGVSTSEVSKWMNGEHPSVSQLCMLRDCSAFSDEARAIFRTAVDAPVNTRRAPNPAATWLPTEAASPTLCAREIGELDADGDSRLTDRDALIWSDRATRVLRMVSGVRK